MDDVNPAGRLWDRTRMRVREEVVDAALALFVDHGFEETTVDQVVATAGISRRSFFRYFGTKEDIVFGDLAEQGPVILDALRARPDDEPIWDALQHAFTALSARITPERGLAIARLVAASPALRAAHLDKHLRWQEHLAPEVERRIGPATDPPGLRGQAIVATALACLDAATTIWVAGGGDGGIEELQRLCDRALAAVRTS
ncbi:Transcriptional regulator, TetR family [Alloactinosynnema sp. L-07]|uniref:TetR/AcrR family transcriptional regulator n=1 Tax=Alloactinosynnema sp. L-07 TaxID=1653480 RepID=UPI00065EFAC2|nr:TetR/AcrR family transcriptional regulator [Alloactinosynnema sp. L-07]CRK61691.1 Transcriptional regulator, TetR family [Alloactinosynnema sp. L-07]